MVTGSADCFVAEKRLAKRLHSDECEAIHRLLDQAEELLPDLVGTFAAADIPPRKLHGHTAHPSSCWHSVHTGALAA